MRRGYQREVGGTTDIRAYEHGNTVGMTIDSPDPGSTRPRVYLAGPDVFLPDALAVGEAKKRLCADHGLEGVFPLDNPIDHLDGLPPEQVCTYCWSGRE